MSVTNPYVTISTGNTQTTGVGTSIDLTATGGVWYHTSYLYIDPYGHIRPQVRQYFTEAGIALFGEEEVLICFYASRRKEVDAVKRECDEWFPIIARKRIVE